MVKRCVEGMKAEGEGRQDDARDLFMQAWAASGDDYEAAAPLHLCPAHRPCFGTGRPRFLALSNEAMDSASPRNRVRLSTSSRPTGAHLAASQLIGAALYRNNQPSFTA